MQISNTFKDGVLSPTQGGSTPDIAGQLHEQRLRHRRALLGNAWELWWPRILVVFIAGLTAGFFGQFALSYAKIFLAVMAGLVILFYALKNTTFALILTTAICTAWAPPAGTIKSLDLYAVYLLVPVLFFQVMIMAAFRRREHIWPSFAVLWPQFGLIVMAVVSNLIVHFTWTIGVPKTLNHNSDILGEIFGLAIYLIPLFTIFLICALLRGREHWVEKIQLIYIVLAVAISLLVLDQFRRLGSNQATFRYTEPQIAYMKLRAIVQLISLGCILSCVRMLCAKTWLMRVVYALSLLIDLVAVYVSLENSWWIEVGIALLVLVLFVGKSKSASALRKQLVMRAFGIILFLLAASPIIIKKISSIAAQKQADYLRLIIWQDGLRVWRKQPFWGVGPGNYWSYDQRFTFLPRYLTNFDKDGLGVAHNGYIQTLAEMGPLGEIFLLSFIAVVIIMAWRLLRRSDKDNPKTRTDYMLGVGAFALVLGSMGADFVSGEFFWPPRQVGSSHSLNQIMTTWVIFAFLFYKDRLRRIKKAQGETYTGDKNFQVEEVDGQGLSAVDTSLLARSVKPGPRSTGKPWFRYRVSFAPYLFCEALVLRCYRFLQRHGIA